MSLSEQHAAIDWTAEPATPREKQIRAAILRNTISEEGGELGRLRELLSLSAGGDMGFREADAASDFRDAWVQAEAALKERRRLRYREVIDEAIREVDGNKEFPIS